MTDRLARAITWAIALQGTEGRKGSHLPYLAHTLGVVGLVLAHGGDETQAVAAALHDVVEDHGGLAAADRIRAEFGDEVADMVLALSDATPEKGEEKRSWWPRKADYITHLESTSPRIALVSAADKIDNIRSIRADLRLVHDAVWGRFNAESGRDGQLWYYGKLTKVLGERLRQSEGAPGGNTSDRYEQMADLLQAEFCALLEEVAETSISVKKLKERIAECEAARL